MGQTTRRLQQVADVTGVRGRVALKLCYVLVDGCRVIPLGARLKEAKLVLYNLSQFGQVSDPNLAYKDDMGRAIPPRGTRSKLPKAA